jgi:outer membrane protein OmpA-like peptidoglycan-associated protein
MKNIMYVLAALPLLAGAQANVNLAANGSFEAISKKTMAPGLIGNAIGMSSANCTTVDLFSADARCKMVKVPENYMGNQTASTGTNYAGIIAFYGDEAGIGYDAAGYDSYTEYLQVELTQPLVAGQTYNVKLKISLADKSAYAVSGLGIVMSKEKFKVDNNSFMAIEPDMISMNIASDKDWATIGGSYTAEGGEQYLVFGAFSEYMVVEKVIPNTVNNSRKAYYYIDDISVVSGANESEPSKDLSFTNGCFKLKNLNFETYKSTILPESFPELDALATFLKSYPTLTIYIDGYTDKTGSEEINAKLSADRANAVKSYLVNKGVNSDNLLTRWYSSEYPIEHATSSVVNRRVEITACCFK